MIKVECDDLNKYAIKLDKKSAQNKEGVRKAIQKSCLSVKRTAMQNLTNNGSVKTGHLRRMIAYKTTLTEGIIHTSNVKYAKGVEDGNKPHIIRAKKAKALYWQGVNHPVKQIRHPGSKGKPFLKPALGQEKPKFLQNLKQAIKLD